MRRLLPLILTACSVDRSTIAELDPREVPTASDLQCQTDQLVAWDGAGWICVDPPAPTTTIDYAVFGACAGDDKVRGVDPTTGAVQCAPDADTRRLPPRYRYGLEVETTGASSLRVRPGACRDRDDTMDITLAAEDPVDLAVPGDAELFIETPDVWYWVWLIADSTGANAPRGFLSVSSSAPILPSGYDRGRLLAAVRNDAASSFVPFSQSGRTSPWVTQVEQMAYQGSAPSPGVYLAVGVSAIVPPGTDRAEVVYADQITTGNVFSIRFRDPDVPAVAKVLVVGQYVAAESGYAHGEVPVGGPAGAEVIEYARDGGAWNWFTVNGYAWGPQEP